MALTLRAVAHLGLVEPAHWDALTVANEPFTRHSYLRTLETSGCVGAEGTGWRPQHLLAYDEHDALVAAMPLYFKTDSYGEFIFDWAWAQAAHDNAIAYYPKLVAAIPYTPATGNRILRRADVTLEDVVPLFVSGLEHLQQQAGASSVHVLFCQADEAKAFAQRGYIQRKSYQFHWQRAAHWHTFDDFLADMRAPCRKQVRKERARAQSHGLCLSMRPITEVQQADVEAMYGFYRQTVWEKGAIAYLTDAFFNGLKSHCPTSTYVAMAHAGETAVAGALFFRQGQHLYGRYWGAAQHFDALHFELCYYLPIAWALEQGITRFEAGAQGEHKLKRGFLPNLCHSVHTIKHAGLQHAVAKFCQQEARALELQMQQLALHGPFHRP